MTSSPRHGRVPAFLTLAAVTFLAACGTSATSAVPVASIPPSSPGEALGVFPGIEGWSYRVEPATVPGFLRGVQETLGDQVQTEIGLAAIATRGDDEVSLIAFGFPGADDTTSVDYFARVLDDMEDGFQAGSQPTLGGDAFLMTAEGRSTIMAPFVRSPAGHLVFLFAFGPQGPTEELAAAVLAADG
ncbi:MAG: hypothetical protein M3Y40_06825 [Chloroflexota bacterium]|nr:hypothetical protein [Chloroflexota bacterium]